MPPAAERQSGLPTQVARTHITGTNDSPIIRPPPQSTLFPYTTLFRSAAKTATGQVTFTDVDASDTHSLSVSLAATYGTATVDPDGTWHYTVTDAEIGRAHV